MGKLERDFQSELIKDLRDLFNGSIITKLDANYIQGIPDLLILFGNRWAVLECKKNSDASKQPNQDWYVDTMNEMSFATFVYPENREHILLELQDFFYA